MIPRRKDDLKNNDDIYDLLKDYDKEYLLNFTKNKHNLLFLYFFSFLKQYNNTIAVHNAYSQTTTEALEMEARKHKDFLEKCVLEEQRLNNDK